MTTTNDAPAPAPSGSGVRVKPLEWEDAALIVSFGWMIVRMAKTPFGIYAVDQRPELLRVTLCGQVLANCLPATIDEAKAAAQADYEARILSALASDASPRGEGPWVAYTQAGAFVAHITSKENFQRMQAAGFDLRYVVAHPAPATVEMHGPFGHLVIPLGLSEEHWRIEDAPVKDADHVSLGMFTKTDPFKVAAEEEGRDNG